MKKKYGSIFILLIFVSMYTAFSQPESIFDEKSPRWGVYGGYNANMHSAKVDSIPGIKSAMSNLLPKGNGIGISLGAFFELPMPDPFYIGLRAGYNILNATFKGTLNNKVVIAGTDTIKGDIDQSFEAKINDISLEPYLRINLFKNFDIIAGGHIALISQSSYAATAEISNPGGAVFPDTVVMKISSSGKIPYKSEVNTGLIFGASYRIPLNHNETFFIAPEILYMLGMNSIITKSDSLTRRVIKNFDWKIDNLRLGVSLFYQPHPPKPGFKTEKNKVRIIDTLRIETNLKKSKNIILGIPKVSVKTDTVVDKIITTEITTRADTLYIYSELKVVMRLNTPVLHIEEQKVTEAFPLIAAVFFPESSSELPDTYRGNNTKIQGGYDNHLTINYNILTEIAARLKAKPKAIVTLIGYADSVTEKGECSLAQKRTESVKNYLVSMYNINEKRIKITEKKAGICTPENPTTQHSDSGYAENRRVEIFADDPSILAPAIKHFIEPSSINPEEIAIDFDYGNSRNVKTKSIKAAQQSKEIFGYEFSLETKHFTHLITKEMAHGLVSGKPLVFTGVFSSPSNGDFITSVSIPVIKDTVESSLERFSLLLFKFASDELQPGAEEILKTMLTGKSDANVRITGYTDILGSSVFNKSLSERRAANTEKMIKKIFPNINILSVTGVGADKYPPGIKSYSTPLERFLSRTVQIEVVGK